MNHGAKKAALATGLALAGLYPSLAWADEQPDDAAARGDALSSREIIVTARRKEENLQDVPQTVAVVTGESLEKLNIQNLNDLDKVVSGLQMSGQQASMRGVTFIQSSVSGDTVAAYMNDAPIRGNLIFTSNFDVGQIEVLRGPQGTLRGIAAPSGAITMTTRKADLNEFGGTFYGALNEHDGYNFQAAVSIPIVQDMLAVRIAGVFDYTDAGGVRSVTNDRSPHQDTKAIRASVRFEPTSTLSFNVMYHHLSSDGFSYPSAVFGSGSPGNTQAGLNNPNISPGYNGPVIGIYDNKAVISYGTPIDTKIDIVTGQADWAFAGQKLSYVGSYQKYDDLAQVAADTGNMLLGYHLIGINFPRHSVTKTHELRLSSEERIAGIFDYVVGVFHRNDDSPVQGINGYASFNPGTFGAPPPGGNFALNALPTTTPNLRYAVALPIYFPTSTKETSLFGNITAHIGDKLEISGGLRYIDTKLSRHIETGSANSFAAANFSVLPPALQGPACAAQGGMLGATYPGVCDILVPARTIVVDRNEHFKPWIYDAVLSYHFTPDLMAYAHFGTSWRQPPLSVGLSNPTGHPSLTALISGRPEKSKSIELGAKWTFLDGRGRLFVDYYHQKYDDFIFSVPGGLRFLTALPSAANANNGQTTSTGVSANVPAKIDGFDIEASFRVTDRWYIDGAFSWVDGKTSGPVPCNDGNLDGIPDNSNPVNLGAMMAAKNIAYATCNVPFSTSTTPKWNARVTSEYAFPVTNKIDAFVRGLFQYQPENPNAAPPYVVPAYGLLDLFVGIRVPERNIEISLYGKNITNTRKILSDPNAADTGASFLRVWFGTSGYKAVTLTPRQEFGLTAKMSFGSH
jgi:iron complex outermembrane receptor protein